MQRSVLPDRAKIDRGITMVIIKPKIAELSRLRAAIAAGDYDLVPGLCPEACIDVTTQRVMEEILQWTEKNGMYSSSQLKLIGQNELTKDRTDN